MNKGKFRNKQPTDTDNIMDIQNVDLDRADEFLLSAKKKKLEDTYRDEDQEDLLFDEQDCKEMATDLGKTEESLRRKESSRTKCKSVKNNDHIHIKLKTKSKRCKNDLVTNDKIVLKSNIQNRTQLLCKKNIKYKNRNKKLCANETSTSKPSTVLVKDQIMYKRDLSINSTKTTIPIINYADKNVQSREENQLLKPGTTKLHSQIKNITQKHAQAEDSKSIGRIGLNTDQHTCASKNTHQSKHDVRKVSHIIPTIKTSNKTTSQEASKSQFDVLRCKTKTPDLITHDKDNTRSNDVQRSRLDVIRPPLLDCLRESDEGHRRSIKVNGSNLRHKMLERLQAAQSRYTLPHRRGRR